MSYQMRSTLWSIVGILFSLITILNFFQGEPVGANALVAVASVIIVRHYNEKIEQEKKQKK